MEVIQTPPEGFPDFDTQVPADGYRWWYLDALADDGDLGLTIIVFIGSVFSPYYARRRRRAATDPEEHCAINVALYGPHHRRWAMTERSRARLQRSRTRLAIGASAIAYADGVVTITIDERAAPVPRPVRGTVELRLPATSRQAFVIGADERHVWWPLAPRVPVSVEMSSPRLSWRGSGYFDTNFGSEPLESGFSRWSWARAPAGTGSLIHYDALRRDGSEAGLMIEVDAAGGVTRHAPAPLTALPSTRVWQMPRETQCEPGGTARVVKTLEDTPFYARSLIETRLNGQDVVAFQETLSLDRFAARWVQTLLPFRMPRLP